MTRRSCVRIAAAGCLAALVLAGCGRKGPLDPPPGAWVTPQGMPMHREDGTQQRATDENGNPVASGPKRRIPADWLID